MDKHHKTKVPYAFTIEKGNRLWSVVVHGEGSSWEVGEQIRNIFSKGLEVSDTFAVIAIPENISTKVVEVV